MFTQLRRLARFVHNGARRCRGLLGTPLAWPTLHQVAHFMQARRLLMQDPCHEGGNFSCASQPSPLESPSGKQGIRRGAYLRELKPKNRLLSPVSSAANARNPWVLMSKNGATSVHEACTGAPKRRFIAHKLKNEKLAVF